MKYILAIDEGTTGTKALLMNEKLEKIAESIIDFEQHFPKPGWVEHDLQEIWQKTLEAIKNVTAKIDTKQIAGIGITNQRETVCFWDKKTGAPLTRAIVWQDRRTAAECQALNERGLEELFQNKTGLLLDPYFSGTKAAWALKNLTEVQSAASAGTLAIGTIDSYLVSRLSAAQKHVTEPSNASRTLCFHLTDHKWDAELCDTLEIPSEFWPEVLPSVGVFAETRNVGVLPDGIPITGILGDQQSALLGQACLNEGDAKCTYGTGAFLLVNTGKKPVPSKHRLVTTIAWAMDETDYTYALEGSAFIAGAAVQWVRDGLEFVKDSPEIETLAKTVSSSEGVVFVPSLTGLGAPHWDPNATGMLTGITRGTKRGHIARAVLEGVAFQNTDILSSMEKDMGRPLNSLNVDGGASRNDLLMQFQADILGLKLHRPAFTETTSLGAVFAAGLGAGIWKDIAEIKKTWKEERSFEPKMDEKIREKRLKSWNDAIARVKL